MTAPRSLFAGMGGHHSASPTTEEWLTPPFVLEALGGAGSFDLDPYPRVKGSYDLTPEMERNVRAVLEGEDATIYQFGDGNGLTLDTSSARPRGSE